MKKVFNLKKPSPVWVISICIKFSKRNSPLVRCTFQLSGYSCILKHYPSQIQLLIVWEAGFITQTQIFSLTWKLIQVFKPFFNNKTRFRNHHSFGTWIFWLETKDNFAFLIGLKPKKKKSWAYPASYTWCLSWWNWVEKHLEKSELGSSNGWAGRAGKKSFFGGIYFFPKKQLSDIKCICIWLSKFSWKIKNKLGKNGFVPFFEDFY